MIQHNFIHTIIISFALGLKTASILAYKNKSSSVNFYSIDIDFIPMNLSLNTSFFNTSMPSMSPSSLSPTSQPSAAPTLSKVSYVEETFEQTLTGRDLVGMTKQQRKAYQYFINNSTKYYGQYGGEPIVQTNCTIRQQILEDSSMNGFRRMLFDKDNNETSNSTTSHAPYEYYTTDDEEDTTPTNLTIVYTIKWSSMYEILNITGYITSYLQYMNSPDGQTSNIYALESIGIPVTNVTYVEVYVPPEEEHPELEINFTDVSSWEVLAVTGLFTLFCTVIFLIIYELGRRSPIISTIFDKRRTCHPQRTPPPLRKDRCFQWLFLKTDIRLFQLSENNSSKDDDIHDNNNSLKEESKREIDFGDNDDSTCRVTTYMSRSASEQGSPFIDSSPKKSILSTISEKVSILSRQAQDNNDNTICTNSTNTNFVCVNGRHVPPQFAEMAISGLLTAMQLEDCEKIVINSIKESKKQKSGQINSSYFTNLGASFFSKKISDRSLTLKSPCSEDNEITDIKIDCEHCKEMSTSPIRSNLHEQTSQLKSMIEKGRHDFSIADILLLQSVGLDQFVFIRFLRFCFDITFYPFILACFTLIPICKYN